MSISKYRICFKIISLIVLVTFLNIQIVWAADGLTLAPVHRETTSQYSPSQVDQAYSNTAQQVEKLANIEELRAKNFSSRASLRKPVNMGDLFDMTLVSPAEIKEGETLQINFVFKDDNYSEDESERDFKWESISYKDNASYLIADKDDITRLDGNSKSKIELTFAPDTDDAGEYLFEFTVEEGDKKTAKSLKVTVKDIDGQASYIDASHTDTNRIEKPMSSYSAPQAMQEIISYSAVPFISGVIRPPKPGIIIERNNITYIDNIAAKGEYVTDMDLEYKSVEYWPYRYYGYHPASIRTYSFNITIKENKDFTDISLKINLDYFTESSNMRIQSKSIFENLDSIMSKIKSVLFNSYYSRYPSYFYRDYFISHRKALYLVLNNLQKNMNIVKEERIKKQERAISEIESLRGAMTSDLTDLTYKELLDIKTVLDTKAVSVYLEPNQRQSQLGMNIEKFNTIHGAHMAAVDLAIENALNDASVTYSNLVLERDNLLIKVSKYLSGIEQISRLDTITTKFTNSYNIKLSEVDSAIKDGLNDAALTYQDLLEERNNLLGQVKDYIGPDEEILRINLIETKYQTALQLRKIEAMSFTNEIHQTMETSLLSGISPGILTQNKDNLIARVENSPYLEPEEKILLTSEIANRYSFIATPPIIKPLPSFINKGNLLVEWDIKEGSTSYALELALNPEFIESVLYNSFSTSFELTGLEPGKSYYLRLMAAKDFLTTSWTAIIPIIDITHIDSLGNLIEYKDGLIVKITDPNGIVSTYNYLKDNEGNIIHKIITTKGETRRYDMSGNLISMTDVEGNSHEYSYTRDAEGNIIVTTENITTPLEDIRDIASGLNPETNLIESNNDSSYIAYTYDQALAIMAFSIAGDYSNAQKALITMRDLQLSDGSWYDGYDARTKEARSQNRYSGPAAFMVMAINWYTTLSGDRDFISTAEKASNWLLTLQNTTENDSAYGSVKDGYENSNPLPRISTDYNLDIYASLKQLANITGNSYYLDRAFLIESYLKTKMWSGERFYTGYNDDKEYLGPQTFGVLILGAEYDSAMHWADNILRRKLLYNGSVLDGYDINRSSWQPDPKGSIWIEGTSQAALAWSKLGYSDYWNYYLDQINHTRLPKGGFIYSLNELEPISYPYNWRYKSLASTAWHFLAANKVNLFNIPASILPMHASTVNITDISGSRLIIENQSIDALLQPKQYVYDAKNMLARKIDSDSTYTEYLYNSNGELTSSYEYLTDGSINIFDGSGNIVYEYAVPLTGQEATRQISAVSVTTSTGDIIQYIGGNIDSVTLKEDGSVISGIELYPDRALKNARIKYSDGSIDIIYEGVLLQKISSKGVISRYRDGKKTTEYAPLRGISNFHFLVDKDGNIAYNMVINKESISTYDAQGALLKILKRNGEIVEYSNGRLQRLVTSDDKEYLYSYVNGDPPMSVLIGDTIDENIPSIIRYDQNNNVIEAINIKGDVITYSGGLIETVMNGDISTQYEYVFNSSGDLEQVEVDRFGLKRIYDSYGNLESISLGGDAKIVYEEGKLKAIEQSDGTVISPLDKIEFDENGNLVTGRVTLKDGTVKEYKNKTLDFFFRPDGIMLDLENGKIKTLITPEDGRYNWQYTKDEDGSEITLIEDLARKETRKYKNGLLWSIANEDGLEVKYEYLDQKISKSIVKSYGKIIQTYIYAYIGNTVEIIDGDGLKRVYSEEQKIISLTTPEGKKYNYNYELDAEGNEKTIVQLVEINGSANFPAEERVISEYDSQNVIIRSVTSEGTVSYYINGLIDKIVDKDGYVIADYEYDSDYNIISLSLDSARKGLSREVTANEEAITKERDSALARLAQEEARVKQRIADEIAPIRADIVKQKREFEQIMDINYMIKFKEFSHFIPFLQDQQEKKNLTQINEDINWMREKGIVGIKLGWLFSWIFSNGEIRTLTYNSESERADAALAERVYFYILMYYTYRYVNYGDNTMYSARFIEIENNSVEWWDNNYGKLTKSENDLNQQEVKAYQDLAAQIAQQRQIIYGQEAKALQKLHEEERLIKQEISVKETIPLVYFWYRKVIGRDPSKVEVDYWTSKATQNLQAPESQFIADYLKSLPEYIQRLNDKETIIEDVQSFFEDYLNTSETEKTNILKELGLDNSEVVSLDSYKIDKIISWMKSVGLHFGDSAYLALKALLDNNGLDISKAEIARLSIIIDILTGVINEEADGNLLLSMYALNKVAEIKGMTLYSAKISFEELRQAQKPLIAHVDDNHYIVITKIENDKVTYLDPGIGETPEEVTTSIEEFQDIWKGYVLIPELPQNPENILTSKEAKSVKGAFFGIIIAIVAAIVSAVSTAVVVAATILTTVVSAIATAVSVIASAVVNVIVTITQLVSAAVANIAQGIGTFFTWVGEGLKFAGNALINIGSKTLEGIKFVGNKLFNIITHPVNVIKEKGLEVFFTESVRDVAINYGVSSGLQKTGLDPTVSNILSAVVSGGITGGIDGGIKMAWKDAITSGSIAGVKELGEETGLDPRLSSIAAVTSGAIVSGTLNGNNVDDILKDISPNIVGELVYAGVQELGENLGVDPRISNLAGIGLRSSISAGLDSNNTTTLWNGAMNGLTRGATSLGFQWAAEELDMDPLVASLAETALTGSIESILEDQSAVKGIYDTFFKAGTGLLTLGSQINSPWSKAAYMAQLLDFSEIIQEQGLDKAFETYAAGFLHQTAIDNIWKKGGIADLVANKAEVVTNEEGEIVKRVYINDDRTDFIDFTLNTDEMVGYKQGNILVDCPVKINPDGKPTTPNGKVKVLLEGKSRIVYHIKNYDFILIEYIDINGETIAFVKPLDGEKSIMMNENNNLIKTGRFYNREKQIVVDKKDNQVIRIVSTPRSNMTDEEIENLVRNGVESEYLDGVTIEYDKNSRQVKIEIDSNAQRVGEFEGKTIFSTLISSNGVSNKFGEYIAPTYEQRLKYRLSERGLDKNTIFLLPMFEGNNITRDLSMWFLDNAGTNILTNELIAKLDKEIYSDVLPGQQYESKVMVVYSGSTSPFFKAINKRHDYNIRDTIVLGGPTFDGIFEDTQITNPNIKRVFNIWGGKENILKPFVSNKKYSGNVDEYNIEILGATHFDYFYDPSRGSLNARSSYFVEKFLERVYTNGDIQGLLKGHGVTYDPEKKKYIIDPYAIDYDPELEWRDRD